MSSIKRERSVNYFANLGVECDFSKLGYNESSFLKIRAIGIIYSNNNNNNNNKLLALRNKYIS